MKMKFTYIAVCALLAVIAYRYCFVTFHPRAELRSLIIAISEYHHTHGVWPESRTDARGSVLSEVDVSGQVESLACHGIVVNYRQPSHGCEQLPYREVFLVASNLSRKYTFIVATDFTETVIDTSVADNDIYLNAVVTSDGLLFRRAIDAEKWTYTLSTIRSSYDRSHIERNEAVENMCMREHYPPHVSTGACKVFSDPAQSDLIAIVRFDECGMIDDVQLVRGRKGDKSN